VEDLLNSLPQANSGVGYAELKSVGTVEFWLRSVLKYAVRLDDNLTSLSRGECRERQRIVSGISCQEPASDQCFFGAREGFDPGQNSENYVLSPGAPACARGSNGMTCATCLDGIATSHGKGPPVYTQSDG
jgi:hypothetical protein